MDNSREWTTKQAQIIASIGVMNNLSDKFRAWKIPEDFTADDVIKTVISSIVMIEGQFAVLLMEDADLGFEEIDELVKKIKSP